MRPRSLLLAPLALFGQAAFFFYLLHAHLLALASVVLGMHKHAGLLATYLAAGVCCVALAPLCAAWRSFRRAHSSGFARYI